MNDSPMSDIWISQRPTGGGCSFRWAIDAPRCGAPVTLHVMSESAIHGVVCIATCEPHAPLARAAGVYVSEHSPSWPDCRCKPAHDQPRHQHGVSPTDATFHGIMSGLNTRPKARYVEDRPAYDPMFACRLLSQFQTVPDAATATIHYSAARSGEPHALCGAGPLGILAANWRAVSCPDCRATETP